MNIATSRGSFRHDGPMPMPVMSGGRAQRNTRRPGSETSRPNGYVTRSTVCPSSSRARIRWYSLKGVPRGSKNGSGAIIRIRIKPRLEAQADAEAALQAAGFRILVAGGARHVGELDRRG